MPFSHHSHSGQFCKHASGVLEEVVLEAIRQNFIVYGLTEHVPRYRVKDFYPEETDTSLDDLQTQFDSFVVEAHRLKALYASQITLLVGAETEFISEVDNRALLALLERHGDRIEYLVGSVHHVNEIPIDFDHPTFERALDSFRPSPGASESDSKMSALLDHYLDAQHELMVRFHPEIIGHMDLCRLYNPEMDFGDFPGALEKLLRNIRFACEYGALIEFNAAAFRKGWDTAYPGKDVVKLVLELGGRFTISDDSHGPHAVGLYYDRLFEYLKDVEISELWYLTKGERSNAIIGQRKLSPVKLEGDWWKHDFWKNRMPS